MKRNTFIPMAVLAGVLAVPAMASAQQEQVPTSNLPLKHTPRPTVAAITPADLMTRLYIFADDSMMGRAAGTIYNDKGTDYIASEVKRLGLQPAGDNGTFFQSAHLFSRSLDSTSTITVDGKTYNAGTDFVATFPTDVSPMAGSGQVMFIGYNLDTLNIPSVADVSGKVLIVGPLIPGFKQPKNQAELTAILESRGYKEYQKMIGSAGAVVSVSPTPFTPARAAGAFHSAQVRVPLLGTKPAPSTISVTQALADAMLGMPVASATKGATGKNVTLNVHWKDTALPGRNVVAILPGSDARLRSTYVAIGAHNDHVGFNHRPIDHDSMRAILSITQPGGAEDAPRWAGQGPPITAEEWVKINAMKDSLRALHGGTIRMDSINNGADDDGTGSMGVLEIAEAFAKAPAAQRPKRSIIFVWHVGEELGMFGSNYFTDHPTVPRDSIVAQLNVDMIGRGGPMDPVPWGGPTYLQLIGSRRLSTELGDIVEQVNKDTNAGFKYDYQFDANGDPHNYYCRSDHWAYARYGIPITFFTTGGHRDYHQITDEPQYIDYNHYAHVAQLIHDVGFRLANLDHRPLVDKPKGDPYGTCQQ
jgi:hypothetical protein